MWTIGRLGKAVVAVILVRSSIPMTEPGNAFVVLMAFASAVLLSSWVPRSLSVLPSTVVEVEGGGCGTASSSSVSARAVTRDDAVNRSKAEPAISPENLLVNDVDNVLPSREPPCKRKIARTNSGLANSWIEHITVFVPTLVSFTMSVNDLSGIRIRTAARILLDVDDASAFPPAGYLSADAALRTDSASCADYDRERAESKRHNAAVTCLDRRSCDGAY